MKDHCSPLDIISTIPQNIIEIILTLMPIRDAVRTSILSTKWRYSWAKIHKFVFDRKQFEDFIVNYQMSKRRKFLYAINQVLLLHQGPILEFTLNAPIVEYNNLEIDLMIFILSRKNTLKKFTLNAYCDKLPLSFYSLQQLTHLNLINCGLRPPSTTFNGFNMLASLSLNHVEITEKVLLHLISGCPTLKHLTLFLDHTISTLWEESSIVQLFKCLNVIEHLNLALDPILSYFTGRVPQKLPTSLLHLKQLGLSKLSLMRQHEYSFTLLLIRSSPNLEKITIKIFEEDEDIMEEIDDFLVLQDYTDVRLDYLTEFEINFFSNLPAELELLKLILVKSPLLKKVHLKLKDVESDKNETEMLRSFQRLPRASPVAEIMVQ